MRTGARPQQGAAARGGIGAAPPGGPAGGGRAVGEAPFAACGTAKVEAAKVETAKVEAARLDAARLDAAKPGCPAAAPGLHVSLVTLGVEDLARAGRFYAAMGLSRRCAEAQGVMFFAAGAVALALYPRHELAADAGVLSGRAGMFGGVTLACNRPDRREVDRTIIAAVAAGGRALHGPHETAWGGYAGYVADPDGHVWEIAHNPGFPLDREGRLALPA
ncbi:VOC family protein [Ancylobacter lacus]|nr:VOC family protein [Ancylobacter lacus]